MARLATCYIYGAIAQLAEYRIVYPVVAGSNPAVLALLYIAAAPEWVALFYILIYFIGAGSGGCFIYPVRVKRDGAVSLDNRAA